MQARKIDNEMQIAASARFDNARFGPATELWNLSAVVILPTCLFMRRSALQFFLFAAAAFFVGKPPSGAALLEGQIYALNFVDVDGHALSTADGHVTVVVLATLADTEKAHTVGDRVPDYCLGDPTYRMITLLNLNQKRTRIGRAIATMLVRRRLDAEARLLQRRYDAKKLERDARRDIFAVTDFDGTLASQLGAPPESSDFHVFVFGRNGELLRQWTDLPSAAELAEVVK
jgi:hypothetical protein